MALSASQFQLQISMLYAIVFWSPGLDDEGYIIPGRSKSLSH